MNKHNAFRSALVIDDSAVQRLHAVDLFQQVGVTRILEACDGQQALALLASLQPDDMPELIMVDLEMPVMDGVQVIQRLQESGYSVPLIIASGRELLLIHTVEAMARSTGMPVLGSLRKPIVADQLKRLLERRDKVLSPRRRQGTPDSGPAAAMGLDADALRRAMLHKQVSMHYQPKVSLQTGVVRGFEALARWRHPDLGMVPPDVFIPLAEREGLIRELTLTLMSECFAQLAQWRATDRRTRSMAINLSPLLLGDLSLVDAIGALLTRHALAAEGIVLEITEGSLAPNMTSALAMLARLRLKGFGLSIDDYGTGFSSMQQLAQFPFTELKIDRSFVCGAHERMNLRVILKSAVDMCRQLELTSVGEGIETMEDWETLRTMGCVMGQGYLIAKPMPGEQVLDWVHAWNTGAASGLPRAAIS